MPQRQSRDNSDAGPDYGDPGTPADRPTPDYDDARGSNTDRGPDFEGPPREAEPQRAPSTDDAGRTAFRESPQFEDAPVAPPPPAADSGPPPRPSPPSSQHPQADSQQQRSPRPRRIAAAIVVIAIIAILLAILLPRQRRVSGRTPSERAGQQSRDIQTAQRSNAPSRTASGQRQQIRQPQQRPRPQQSRRPQQYPQPQQPRRPQQTTQPQQNPQPQSPPAPATSQTSPRQYRQVQPAQPTDQTAPTSDTLFTRPQAQRVVEQAAATETAARNQALRLFIAELRKPQYQDPDQFAILAAALATAGPGMVPGGAKEGHREIFQVVSNSRTGTEAADRLEKMGYESALPRPVQQALLGLLASATSVADIVTGIDRIESQTGVELAPRTTEQLKKAAQQAQAAKQRRNSDNR